jgi:predicted DNA-binding transcriptional regulator AlpA
MTELPSPLVFRPEAVQRSTLSSVTLWRWEKIGKFPKPIKISARRIAYRREEFEAWLRDPEAWRPPTAATDESDSPTVNSKAA